MRGGGGNSFIGPWIKQNIELNDLFRALKNFLLEGK